MKGKFRKTFCNLNIKLFNLHGMFRKVQQNSVTLKDNSGKIDKKEFNVRK